MRGDLLARRCAQEPGAEAMRQQINRLFGLTRDELRADGAAAMTVARFLGALEAGTMRAANRDDATGRWVVDPDVKKGILLAFRLGDLEVLGQGATAWTDKHTLPLPKHDLVAKGVRIVPGGSSPSGDPPPQAGEGWGEGTCAPNPLPLAGGASCPTCYPLPFTGEGRPRPRLGR
jgi:hypothetical protein